MKVKEIPDCVWHALGFDPSDPWDWVNMGTVSKEDIDKVMEDMGFVLTRTAE